MYRNTSAPASLWGIMTLILLIGMSAHSGGCRRKKEEEPSKTATSLRTPDFLLKSLQSGKMEKAHSLTAKTSISASGDGGSISATANIIWLKDSVLWINVKKFGIEAARALITRDSIFVLNRLERTYTATDLSSLQRQYSLPGGFDLLQAFLLGYPWFFEDIRLQSDIQDSLHRLHGENQEYGVEYFVEEGSFKLRREGFSQKMASRQVSFLFDDLRVVPELFRFPFKRSLTAVSPETGRVQVDMEVETATFNSDPAPAYKFEVPSHYKRK